MPAKGQTGQIFEHQLIELAFRNLKPMLLVNLAAALCVALLLSNEGIYWVWHWFGVHSVATLLRLKGCFGFAKAHERHNGSNGQIDQAMSRFWRMNYRYGLFFTGLLWAFLTVFCLNAISLESRFLLLLSVSALAGGATGVLAPLKLEGRIYITIMIIPGALALLWLETPVYYFSVLAMVFWGVMLVGHNNNHRLLCQSLSLETENRALISDLTQLNNQLEIKVNERTLALEHMAYYDALSGLLNRRGLMAFLEKTFASMPKEAAVLFIDLDRFKQVNDVLGHDVGDHVLKSTATRLNAALNAFIDQETTAKIARWGGDEFVVIVSRTKAIKEMASALAKHLIDETALPIEVNGEPISLGMSIGMAFYPEDAQTHQGLIQAADLAVAEVKRTGRGQIACFTDMLSNVQKRRFDLSIALNEAIKTEGMRLHYQPIICAKTGHIAAYEALARWEHPQLGVIIPDEFVRLAEDTDRIQALGDWVLLQAIKTCASWTREDFAPHIAVNVSVKQLLSENFAIKVMSLLLSQGLAPSRLDIEVTESVFDEDGHETILDTVQSLRNQGIAVHIDDFGTGYSSLSRLHRFPVTAIKIDKAFVDKMFENGTVIIESTIMIARRFGYEVIAEGVETFEQAQALSALGVDYFQGYYFAKPSADVDFKGHEPIWQAQKRQKMRH